MKGLSYRHTVAACYAGYMTQAIVNNLGSLLLLTFQRQFDVSLGKLALLVSLNFTVQLLVDLAAVKFADRIGYRAAAVSAHVFCTAGLLLMGTLPFVMPPYAGLVIAVTINALGGGLLEVIVSPIVEALPTGNKSAAMALLHSFYCWGYVGVVLLSTLYFTTVGTAAWRYLPMLWAVLPFANIFFFAAVPMKSLSDEGTVKAFPFRFLFSKKVFVILFVMMIASGASEQAMSQWASLFAEAGLKVSKTAGDLLGPCAFAVLMGLSRVFFGSRKTELELERILFGAASLCLASYFVTVFSPYPFLSLAGCAVSGLSVGIMWPGTFSLASRVFPSGGTAMFALLALSGDVGCAAGPGLAGAVMNRTTLKTGVLAAAVFPLLLAAGVLLLGLAAKSRFAARRGGLDGAQ
ncbi:MAG: MFS transporter [Treponema sp.]|jgi:fucose permease|nr:MFS transporter [Treponema sp.]